ncbi:hypothetical protein NM208_g9437 [Fusarium decemcellulare]|uniref:Uncharacterized protein n=1 Tax=Fusarium decemcellulare TaxID=57161 RepID=A0ACC1S1P3_9HYPO|nr:hypothetical protein NM208_g9437 [Fusarium decemcellulare]
MRRLIKLRNKAGRDLDETRDEEGEGGILVQAIWKSEKKIVTQRIFKDINLPTMVSGNGGLAGATPRRTSLDNAEVLAIPPKSESNTTSTLKSDQVLRSIDIPQCEKLLPRSIEWHVVDPGYPSENSTLCRSLSAQNLVSFVHDRKHWSLCQLYNVDWCLYHYTSRRNIKMPVSDLVTWLQKKLGMDIRWSINVGVPQQDDNTNCGIFALAVFQCLLANQDIPLRIKAGDPGHIGAEILARMPTAREPRFINNLLMPTGSPEPSVKPPTHRPDPPGITSPLPSSVSHQASIFDHHVPNNSILPVALRANALIDPALSYSLTPFATTEAQATLAHYKALVESRVKLRTGLKAAKAQRKKDVEKLGSSI